MVVVCSGEKSKQVGNGSSNVLGIRTVFRIEHQQQTDKQNSSCLMSIPGERMRKIEHKKIRCYESANMREQTNQPTNEYVYKLYERTDERVNK